MPPDSELGLLVTDSLLVSVNRGQLIEVQFCAAMTDFHARHEGQQCRHGLVALGLTRKPTVACTSIHLSAGLRTGAAASRQLPWAGLFLELPRRCSFRLHKPKSPSLFAPWLKEIQETGTKSSKSSVHS